VGKVHVHHNINTCAVNPYGEEEPRDSFLAKIAPNGRVPTVVRATNLHGYTATARIHGLFLLLLSPETRQMFASSKGKVTSRVPSPRRTVRVTSSPTP